MHHRFVTFVDGLLSGDADNIPSLDYVKGKGRHVGVIEFLGGSSPEKRGVESSSRLKVSGGLRRADLRDGPHLRGSRAKADVPGSLHAMIPGWC
jgi:hypothetical protein